MFVAFGLMFSWTPTASWAEETPTTAGDVFGEIFRKDDTVLKEYPNIAKAHKIWEEKIDAAVKAYVSKIEAALEREQGKGNSELLKVLKSAAERSKTQHATPCILYDRLPGRISEYLFDMNKNKSRANKLYVNVLEKEIAAMVRKDAEKAKKLEEFLLSSFVPGSLHIKIGVMARSDNRLYLLSDHKVSWPDAYTWCRERHADLASIGNAGTQAFVLKYLESRGQTDHIWFGGIQAENRYIWSDGTPFGYTNWQPGEPSKVHGGKVQDRIAFNYAGKGRWDDLPSGNSQRFLAQWTLY